MTSSVECLQYIKITKENNHQALFLLIRWINLTIQKYSHKSNIRFHIKIQKEFFKIDIFLIFIESSKIKNL